MRRLIVMSLIGLLLTLSTTAFGQDEGFPTVVDAYGEEIVIEDASRLVTMGGSVTEIVFALGAGDRVVARDSSSLYPLVVEELDEVGYVRQLSAEPILAMEPTLIITIEDAGPPEAIEQLEAAGVTMLVVPTAESVEGVVEKVNTIAMALELEDEGVTLVETIEANYASALALQEDIESTPRVMFLYARGAGAVSVSGTDTSANTMIELVGAENAVTEFDGYQPITAESVVTAAPDVILLMTRGLASLGGVDGLLEQPGIAQTPAGENRRVVVMDDLYLLGFSTRTGSAVLDLTYLVHDEVEPPLLSVLRADGRFNTLLDAMESAGQTRLLTGDTPYTLFAPTDEAFASLPPGTLDGLMSSPISLQAVLSYHVVDGAVMAEDVIELDGETVQTLYSEGLLSVGAGDDGVVLNETTNVIETDRLAANGVVHVVDSVLLPERP